MGVAALSGVVDPAALERGIGVFSGLGFEVVRAPNLECRYGLFAGTDGERIDGLHRLLEDEGIEAVLFARGGHGVLRLLPEIDWELMARRMRWFMGYSDVTPLLMQVVSRLGWPVLHGPMVAVEPARGLDDTEAVSLRRALAGDWPLEIPLAGVSEGWSLVEGPLVGGCLSMLAATAGTPWSVHAAGSVLFVEDVAEPLYRIDRMFQQLRLAGALDSVRGIVVGNLAAGGPRDASTEEVVEAAAHAAGAHVPVAWGCSSGHCRPNLTLALGARARVVGSTLELDPTDGSVIDAPPGVVSGRPASC